MGKLRPAPEDPIDAYAASDPVPAYSGPKYFPTYHTTSQAAAPNRIYRDYSSISSLATASDVGGAVRARTVYPTYNAGPYR